MRLINIKVGTKVMLAAVVPAAGDENAPLLEAIAAQIEQVGGQIVGRIVQRHGVSRGKNRGGASAMRRAAPLNPRTVLGTGKADELAELVRQTGAELVVFCNPLTPTQKRQLEKLTGVEVASFSETKKKTKNDTGIFVLAHAHLKHETETNSSSPYRQYTDWLLDLKTTFANHLQGVSYYAAEFYVASTESVASSVPLFSAYDTLDALNRGFGYPESDTKEGYPKGDIKDEKGLDRKMEDLRLRLIEIIYGMEKEGSIDNEHRFYNE